MIKNIIVAILVVFALNGVYAQETHGKSITALNEVNDKMTEFKFRVDSGINDSDVNAWIEQTKGLAIIKGVKLVKKNSQQELVWAFNQSPTLSDFKVLFAVLDIQQIKVKEKIMSAVDFTTFGFSNDTKIK